MQLGWDVDRILDALGGSAAFSNECRRRGWDISLQAILKWRERQSIPAHGLAAAALVLKSRGHSGITTFIYVYGEPRNRKTTGDAREQNDQ